MPRVHTSHFPVEFGDCDPAQIVYFPNFFRWVDAASRRFFIACGLPSWQDSEAERGIIGTPLVDTHARFLRPASYGDQLHRIGGRYALCTMCIGVGQGIAMIVERV